jgi:Flp pilus assembly protein TadD
VNASSPHILGPRADALLILGSPVIALALVFGLASRWPSESVWAVIITFGAVGHHLPGFIRTYGDRELFARFRWRFVLAPPVFFFASFAMARQDLHGLLWISLAWSIWHGMMQHFGFMRIYDAKRGVPASAFGRSDFWLTAAAFGSCLLWSPEQSASVLDGLYTCGVPLLPASLLRSAKWAGVVLLVFAVAAWLLRTRSEMRKGNTHAPLKLVLLVSTLAVVAIARVFTADPFIGVAIFEVLHDVQYLAIVWAFESRPRADGHDARGGPRAWLTRSWPVYVLACLAYGSIAWGVHRGGPSQEVHEILIALLATSALLHYYYDGFIWKVRARDTREHLGLDASDGGVAARTPGDHSGIVQAIAFASACVVLVVVESRGLGPSPAEQAKALAQSVPKSVTARRNHATSLLARGEFTSARIELEAAIDRLPKETELYLQLFDLQLTVLDLPAAESTLARVTALAPATPGLHRRRGQLALRHGNFKAASAALEFARAEQKPDAPLLNDLGFAYLQLGALDTAFPLFKAAIATDPGHAGAWLNLGLVQARTNRVDAALISLARAVELDPRLPQAHNSLGGALMMAGRRGEAIAAFERALDLDPDFVPAKHNLERARRRNRTDSP